MSDEDLLRTIRFWRQLQDRVSTHREEFRWGTAYLDLDFPVRYDSNHLWLDRSSPEATVEALTAEADRILGGAGLAHRELQIAHDPDGIRLSAGFSERGYRVDRLVTMAHRPGAKESIDTSMVEVVDLATARPAIELATSREPYATSDEVVRQLTDYKAKLEREIGCRFYVVRVGGRPVAYCELYVIDGAAQVEDVNTLEEFRGRGFAKAIVSKAVSDARTEGCDLVFLYADRDDWPQHLYGNLGFGPIGNGWEFILEPSAEAAPTQHPRGPERAGSG